MRWPPTPRACACLSGLTAAGLIASHFVAYRLAAPAGGHGELLASTGHAHWSWPLLVAAAVLVGARPFLGARSPRRARASESGAQAWAVVGRRLVESQLVAFAVLETSERLVPHGGLDPAAPTSLLPILIGVVVILAATLLGGGVVVLGALARRWVERRLRARSPAPRAGRIGAADPLWARGDHLAGPATLRGPPGLCRAEAAAS